MNNSNHYQTNLELVEMRQLRLENDMMKRAVHALLETNLKTKEVKEEGDETARNKVLTDKDDILLTFKSYLNDNQLADNSLSDSTFISKREEIGPYYPPGKLSSNNVKNICARLGIPFYMVFCQDFGDHKNGVYMRHFYKFKADDIMKLYQTHQKDKEIHWLLKQKPAPYETSNGEFQVLPVKEEPFDPKNPHDYWATDKDFNEYNDFDEPVTIQSCTTERALAKEELSIVAHDTNEKSGIDIIKTLANFIEFTDQRRYSLTLRNHALKDIFQVIIPQLNLTLLNGDFEDTLQHILQNTSSATEKEIRLRKLQNFVRPKGTSLKNAITSVSYLFKKYHDLPEAAHFGPKLEKNKKDYSHALHTFVISAIRQLVAPQLLSTFETFLKSAQYANIPTDLMQITYLLDKDEESKGCMPTTDLKLNPDNSYLINNIMNKNHYQPSEQSNWLEHNNVSNTGALNSMNFEKNSTGATDNVSDSNNLDRPHRQILQLLPVTKKYNEGAGNTNDSGELGAIPKKKSLPFLQTDDEAIIANIINEKLMTMSSNNMTSNHGHRGREMSKTSSSKQRQRSASKSPTVSFDSRSKSPNYNKAKEKFDKAYEKHKSRFRYKDYNSSRDSSRDSSYERKDRAKNRDRYESNNYSSSKESKSGSYKNNRHRSLSSENRNRSSSNDRLKSVNSNLSCNMGVNCNGIHIDKCLKCLGDHHTHKCTFYYILAKKECSQCPGQLHYFSECQVMAKKKLLSSKSKN